jgi:predicted regulator of Ras-like GTPase activity (Roadblock/LC7/MglB family)
MPSATHHTASDRRSFPGWHWVAAVGLAFPVSGLIAWKISGPVDTVAIALIGGALTGAGLGAAQWWAAKGAFGAPTAWIGASAAGYGAGLAAGAALVGYDTDIASLALMGQVSGAVLGATQGLVLTRRGDRQVGLAWGAAMPVLFGLGWTATTAIGVSVEEQFTVFGAAGAILFMLLSGLLFARITPSNAQVA